MYWSSKQPIKHKVQLNNLSKLPITKPNAQFLQKYREIKNVYRNEKLIKYEFDVVLFDWLNVKSRNL